MLPPDSTATTGPPSAAGLGLAADGGPAVAVLSGGNIDPSLLADVLAPES